MAKERHLSFLPLYTTGTGIGKRPLFGVRIRRKARQRKEWRQNRAEDRIAKVDRDVPARWENRAQRLEKRPLFGVRGRRTMR
jgi:hypothetical protein